MGCLNSVQGTRHGTKNQLIVINNRKIIKQKIIAEGAYGEIWKCLQPDTNQIFAIKLIRLQTKQLTAMFQKQATVLVTFFIYLGKTAMRNQNAKNVVKIIDSAKYTIQQFQLGLILLEFSHMSLYEEIQNKRFTSQEATKILIQILNGLCELHQQNFHHLDIKPQNIIYCKDTYKICDLGSAIQNKIDFKTLTPSKKTQIQQFIQSNSTLMYRSPQMVDSYGKVIGPKSDVWMAGLIGYMLIYRKQPFQNKGKLAILTPVQFTTDGVLQSIIKKMLIINPQERISCRLALNELESSLAKT